MGKALAAYESALARQGGGRDPVKMCTRSAFLEATEQIFPLSEVTGLDIDSVSCRMGGAVGALTERRPRPDGAGKDRSAAKLLRLCRRAGLLGDARGHPGRNPMAAVIAPTLEQRPNDFLRPIEDAALLDAARPCPNGWWSAALALDRATCLGGMRAQTGGHRPDTGPRVSPRAPQQDTGRCTNDSGRPVPRARIESWLAHLHGRGKSVSARSPARDRPWIRLQPTYVWRLVKRAGEEPMCVLSRAPAAPRSDAPRLRMSAHAERRECLSDHPTHASSDIRARPLLNRGLRLEVVSKLLGHSSTVVTERAYAELLGATIRDEFLCGVPRST